MLSSLLSMDHAAQAQTWKRVKLTWYKNRTLPQPHPASELPSAWNRALKNPQILHWQGKSLGPALPPGIRVWWKWSPWTIYLKPMLGASPKYSMGPLFLKKPTPIPGFVFIFPQVSFLLLILVFVSFSTQWLRSLHQVLAVFLRSPFSYS